MDTQLYRTFLAVAAGLSFRKAAGALNLAPSTVTCQIKDLEEKLGARLFERLGRGVSLTGDGRRLAGMAQDLLDREERLKRAVSGGEGDGGELRVRISESLGIVILPAIVPALRARFPHTRLSFATRSKNSLAGDLRGRATDLALLLGEPFAEPGLRMRVISRAKLALIAAPGTGPAGPVARAADLSGQTLIVTPYAWSARPRLDLALAEAGAVLGGLIECGSLEIVKRLVAAGLGLSVAPKFAVKQETKAGTLKALPFEDHGLSAPVLLISDASRDLPPVARTFVQAVEAFFNEKERGGVGVSVG